MITALAQGGMYEDAVVLFGKMRGKGLRPNEFGFSSVVQASSYGRLVGFGWQVHCLCVKCGFSRELFVGSNLADMYSKFGEITDACKVFQEMVYKDVVSWTAMIDGYAKNGEFEAAALAFKEMVCMGVVIDHYVMSSALHACGAMGDAKYGKSLHSVVIKSGLEKETALGNALTDMYFKARDMGSASRVFSSDSRHMDIVSYTSLINGYVEAEQIDMAMRIFLELRRQELEPNEFTFSTLIKACADEAALEQGMQLHAQVVKFSFGADPFVSSTLVDMYGKCGLVDHAVGLFDRIENHTVISWNSLIGAFAQHGLGKEAIKVFERMIAADMKPNAITFGNVLKGCSHAGLVQEGLDYFHTMESRYGVTPKEEHYSHVIDLLSRAGKLKQVEEFIQSMPFEPNAFGWCSYLAACRNHSDMERGKVAAENLMRLEPENSGAHVLLSTIYANERQWEGVRDMRKMMKDGSLKKLPGYSWLDIGNQTHIFIAEDSFHPQQVDIYKKLDSLIEQIKIAGYVPQTTSVPYEMDEDSKEKLLRHHSEKIAVAFALLRMPSGKPIIIKKNLRVCVDCHAALKLIAKVTTRKIIVRDNSRFHHFSDGSCSCRDYW
ncbi:hypothetical protein Droror1_Dr00026320 [Drosera rotundifolia]